MYKLFKIHFVVPTPVITISPSGPIQRAIIPQVINCTVHIRGEVKSSSVMISWIGPRGNIINDSGMTINPTNSTHNDTNYVYTSSLQFTYLMEGDEGTYTCNVTILDTIVSQSVEIQSIASKLKILLLNIIFINYHGFHTYCKSD